MKKVFVLLALLVSAAASATTFTLNNNNPSPGQFTTWTAALAAASHGDTILVQGSTLNYGTFNITKRLTVIGAGHNPVDKQDPSKTFLDYITFHTGSQGAKVFGLEVYSISIPTGNANIDSVTVANCRINYQFAINSGNCEFWIFDGNVFAFSGYCIDAQGQPFGDAIFQNNIFNGQVYAFNGTYIGYNYFNNNNFLGSQGFTFNYCNNIYVNNNIFYRMNPAIPNCSNIIFSNNSSFPNIGFPNGTNFVNVDPLFVTNIGAGAFFSYATDYHLQPSSTLLTSGTDGKQLGVYGGVGDFDNNGIPRNPYIKTFNLTGPANVNAGDNLQIYIKAKVRN